MGFKSVHLPVLKDEVTKYLRPKANMVWVDGTVGAGGHAASIMEAVERVEAVAWVIGTDRDREMLKLAGQKLHDFQFKGQRIDLVHASYAQLPSVLQKLGVKQREVDVILLDLGVSSVHVDDSSRGFSFSKEGPLDMRFDREAADSALEYLKKSSEAQLTQDIRDYGEEPWAKKIAQSIKKYLTTNPEPSTLDLAEVIRWTIPKSHHPKKIDAATKTFQAIRIAVNQELEHLKAFLGFFPNWVKSGGRVGIISFHSLEDRLVKASFAAYEKPCTCPPDLPVCACGKTPVLQVVTRKPVMAGEHERAQNPRARSARFRVVEML